MILQTQRLTLNSRSQAWLDTQIVLGIGETLRVRSEGSVDYEYAVAGRYKQGYPEGSYDSYVTTSPEDPGAVLGYASEGGSGKFVVTNTVPYSIALRVTNTTPPATAGSVSNALRPNRDTTFTSGALGTGRVWLIFNDKWYSDNEGSFSVTLDRIAAPGYVLPPNMEDLGDPIGGRNVPALLWTHLQGASQTVTRFWVIKPLHGDVEYYVALDAAVDRPEYTSLNGLNLIEAATYLPNRGVDMSNVPVTLERKTDGTDVVVLNFDRARLKNQYYEGAEVEVFESNWEDETGARWVVLAGTLGTAQVGEMQATIELTPYEDLLEKPIGDTIEAVCPHPFGEGGCRNPVLNDGPLLADWTRPGEVLAVDALSKLTVRVSGVTSGDDFLTRLQEGRLVFTGGGDMVNVRRDVKTGEEIAFVSGEADVELTLHVALPVEPQIGDPITLSTGCKKDPPFCILYNNLPNGGFVMNLPTAAGVRNQE